MSKFNSFSLNGCGFIFFAIVPEQKSIFFLLLILAFSSDLSAQMVERGPYIQSTTPSSSIIRWKTQDPTDTKIWYGNTPGNLTTILTDTTSEFEHEVLISGLAPNTKYYYAIGDATGVMEGDTTDYYFKTHPVIGSKEKFHAWVLGDPGTGYQEQLEGRDLYYSMEPGGETPLLLTVGDNAYEDGEFQEFNDFFFEIYRDIFRRTSLWAIPGNHDYRSCDQDNEEGPFFDLFTNPQNGESGGVPSGSQRHYSFDYANVHFIVVEGYEHEGQIEWLAEDLAQNTQDWTIALAHHPPYSDGNHNSDNSAKMSYVREVLNPILEAAGVDLFIAGHSHVYERSFLMHGHYEDSDELVDSMIIDGGSGKLDVDGPYQKTMIGPDANKGTVYIVSGSSGGKSPDGSLDHPIMYEDHKQEGHGVLEIENDTLHYTFYQANGVIRDYFTIVKELLPELDVDDDGYDSTVDCDDNNPLVNPGATEIPNNTIDEDCDGVAQIDSDLDGFYDDVDCDDMDASVNPDATEIPNNDVDEDCDGIAQIIDVDQDGFNSDVDCDDNNAFVNSDATEIPNNDVDEDCDGIAQIIDVDQDGFNSDVDCDDNNALVNADATEIPNNDVDEDCDGIAQIIDVDQDGFNSDVDCDDNNALVNSEATEILNNDVDEDCDGIAQVIDVDNDGFNSDEDCDDDNPNINPGATEIPDNGIDEDCNGADGNTVIDMDMDGFNSAEDCDDNNALVNPDAAEILNNDIDEDCDGYAAYDLDNDGFTDDVDCDDENPNINPGVFEIANNDIDENCDNIIITIDVDMDGFNSDEDCDDFNAAANPDATEIVNNDVDENCDGYIAYDLDDDGFLNDVDCDDLDASVNPDAVEIPNNTIDEDCDGVAQVIDADMDGFNSDEDCDELNPEINPDATEIPNNDVDEDCDGIAQVIDADMDGFNSDEDCDELNPEINPDATEIPNNDVDEDCDGIAQVIDDDMDGFNSDEDCDDNNPEINEDAIEIPNNGIDEDCDGEDLMTAVRKIVNSMDLNIYPNPASDHLMLKTDLDGEYEVCIYSVIGSKLISLKANEPLLKIDLSALENGLYLIEVKELNGDKRGGGKFAKM